MPCLIRRRPARRQWSHGTAPVSTREFPRPLNSVSEGTLPVLARRRVCRSRTACRPGDDSRTARAAARAPRASRPRVPDRRHAAPTGAEVNAAQVPTKGVAMNRLLIATDGSPAADAAVQAGVQLAAEQRGGVVLLHVIKEVDVVAPAFGPIIVTPSSRATRKTTRFCPPPPRSPVSWCPVRVEARRRIRLRDDPGHGRRDRRRAHRDRLEPSRRARDDVLRQRLQGAAQAGASPRPRCSSHSRACRGNRVKRNRKEHRRRRLSSTTGRGSDSGVAPPVTPAAEAARSSTSFTACRSRGRSPGRRRAGLEHTPRSPPEEEGAGRHARPAPPVGTGRRFISEEHA